MSRLQDVRAIPPEQLFERRKQAVALFKKGMLRKDIAPIVGVGRNRVDEWITAWQEGGIRALKVCKAGALKGSGIRLNQFEQERIRYTTIQDAPDQLKLPFALWTREAVRQLIEQTYGINLPFRTVGNYLRKWKFTTMTLINSRLMREIEYSCGTGEHISPKTRSRFIPSLFVHGIEPCCIPKTDHKGLPIFVGHGILSIGSWCGDIDLRNYSRFTEFFRVAGNLSETQQ